jgi:hypothetical protein
MPTASLRSLLGDFQRNWKKRFAKEPRSGGEAQQDTGSLLSEEFAKERA